MPALTTKVALTRTPEEFHAYFDDQELEILDAIHLNENLDRIVYRRRAEFQQAPATNSVPIAVFVTAYGRRRLYDKFVEAVSNNATLIYGDTDSMIIKRKIDKPAIKEGYFQIKKLGKNF